MREIKFRAWNVATKVMIDLRAMTPLALNMDTDGLFIPFSDGLILEQYTGLHDKNGVECYFGDKVKHDNGDIGFIEWDEGRCGVCFSWPHSKYDTKSYPISNADYIDFEVIGNIHEDKT